MYIGLPHFSYLLKHVQGLQLLGVSVAGWEATVSIEPWLFAPSTCRHPGQYIDGNLFLSLL